MQEILDINKFAIPEWSSVSKYTAAEFESHRKAGTLITYVTDLFDIYRVNKRVMNDYLNNREIYIPDNRHYNAIFFAINSLLEVHDEHVVWSLYENEMLPKEEFPLQHLLPFSNASSTRRKLIGLTAKDLRGNPERLLFRGMGNKTRKKADEILGKL